MKGAGDVLLMTCTQELVLLPCPHIRRKREKSPVLEASRFKGPAANGEDKSYSNAGPPLWYLGRLPLGMEAETRYRGHSI